MKRETETFGAFTVEGFDVAAGNDEIPDRTILPDTLYVHYRRRSLYRVLRIARREEDWNGDRDVVYEPVSWDMTGHVIGDAVTRRLPIFRSMVEHGGRMVYRFDRIIELQVRGGVVRYRAEQEPDVWKDPKTGNPVQ